MVVTCINQVRKTNERNAHYIVNIVLSTTVTWMGKRGQPLLPTTHLYIFRTIFHLILDQDGAEPSGNSVSCHNLQRLAAYADKSAAPEGGDREREMAMKLLKAFSKRLNDTPTALPEMMSALMFYNDSPTQVCLE